MKVLVIGGGASGMMAALTAAEDPNNTVTLLERQNRVGRKLLATGNGRCNLSNIHADVSHYHGEDPGFVRFALERFGVDDTLTYFKSLGLLTVTEDSGKVYPFSDQANSVVDVLRFALERHGVQVLCSREVISIGKKARGYTVKTAEESFYCDKLIVACGGAAGSKLGGTDFGYRLLASMGHSCTSLSPSLVQLKTDTSFTRSLKGVRADAKLTLKQNGTTLLENRGEVQFTDFGISGPAVFEISRYASDRKDLLLLLDLLQPMQEEELCDFLLQKQSGAPEAPLEDFLTGVLHNRLGRVVLQYLGLELSLPASAADCKKVAHLIKFFPLTITGTMGLEQAQVTAGGVPTSEFRPDTLESRRNPGLFATGEVLDIDGDCGGYNLQWAWSSGRLAGKLGGNKI
ncbi:MAG: NAD(P)/FAD-dependent oxidoreductase [Oscillospiraceae bacterium]|nr:NAD(P)/FAD-dependent oxidoreductase [Oscillospiraceae bacterium]